MNIVDDSSFLTKLCGNKALSECGVMPLEEINKIVSPYMPAFSKRGSEMDEFTVLAVDSITDFEGIVKIISLKIIPPGKKNLERARNHIIICDVLPRVIVPIILKIQEEVYILLVSQKRVTLGGRHTIEVFRGSVEPNCDPINFGKSLVERKINLIEDLFDLIQVRDLGTYWNNSGNSGTSSPIQALFYVAKKNIEINQIKKTLKVDFKFETDPLSGPPLPVTSPVFRKLSEVMERMQEITNTSTDSEAYINDLFSITALAALKESLNNNPLPY
jgi:hypothetical protein